VSNVLSEEKRKQVIALGQLGWTLRRIEKATGVRHETASGYLKAAGIPVRPPGAWGRKPAAKPANADGVTTDSETAKPANGDEASTDPAAAKPANGSQVTTDSASATPSRSPAASACEPYRELIESGLSKGRNAMAIWQDLVDQHGFGGSYESVKRYVRKLRGSPSREAAAVIITAPGEDYGESGVMLRTRRRSAFGVDAAAHVPLLGVT
jgi:hypothetical protein